MMKKWLFVTALGLIVASLAFRSHAEPRQVKNVLPFSPISKKKAQLGTRFYFAHLPPRAQGEPFLVPDEFDDCGLFSETMIQVKNIPFRIPSARDIPETGLRLEDQKPLDIRLPPDREIFLLIWAKIPPYDDDAGPSKPPIAPIDQSERFTVEIAYADGTRDQRIPFNVQEKRYGIDNGPAMYVIHAAQGKTPRRLTFHDKTYKCSFAVMGVTCNSGNPISPEPRLGELCAWYPSADREFPSTRRRIEATIRGNKLSISDGIIAAGMELANGMRWNSLDSPVYGRIALGSSGVFAIKRGDVWIGSEKWKVAGTRASKECLFVDLKYEEGNLQLKGTVKVSLAGPGRMKLGLELVNEGSEPFVGRIRFPILEGVRLGPVDDTWYFIPQYGAAMIHRLDGSIYGSHGHDHPLQVDSFFNPKKWYALTLLGNDLEGQFHWYDVGKSSNGGWYRLEYLEKLLKSGSVWNLPDCTIVISPGDWRDSFRLYEKWVGEWYTPKPPAREWYRRSFVQGWWYPKCGTDFVAEAEEVRRSFGYCDGLNTYGWHVRQKKEDQEVAYSGEYDRSALWLVGGEESFKAAIGHAGRSGIPVSLYTNALIINDKAYHFGASKRREEWTMRGPNEEDWGAVGDNDSTVGYRPCLSAQEWLDYMVGAEEYLTQGLGARICYLDEFGFGARICESKKHAHVSPYPHFYGERELTRRTRAALADDVAICTEYPPEDTRLQYQDGFYCGGIKYSHYPECKKLMNVPMNMVRFAFPDSKCFNLFYNYSLKDGNWDMLKFVLFNGDSYALVRSYAPEGYSEDRSLRVLRKMFRVLHENADAFTSRDVDPLIPTKIPGTFANRFRGKNRVVWTVYNANYQTVRGKLLSVARRPGAKYVDVWNGAAVKREVSGGSAWLTVEIGPRDIACIVQVSE